MESVTKYDTRNNLIRHVELTESNKQWQHPWHLVRRVHLHEELKRRAICPDGDGVPVNLRLQSRVTQVDPASSTAILESGERVRGDVLIGADVQISCNRIQRRHQAQVVYQKRIPLSRLPANSIRRSKDGTACPARRRTRHLVRRRQARGHVSV